MSEILVQFFVVLYVYCGWRFYNSSGLKWIALLQVALVGMFLTKPVFYLFVVPHLIVTTFLCWRVNRKYIVAIIIPCLVLGLYCHRNYLKTGSYDFSSIQTINLIHYNLNYLYLNKFGQEKANDVTGEIYTSTDHINSYADRQAAMRRLAVERILEHPFSYLKIHLKGCLAMFIDPGRFDLVEFFNLESEGGLMEEMNRSKESFGIVERLMNQPLALILTLGVLLIVNCAKFFGFLVFTFSRRKVPIVLLLLSVLMVGYIAVLVGPVGASRFLVPVLPIYLYSSLVGIHIFKRSIDARFLRVYRPLDTDHQS
jgi:4-amino-4-deoxy-L-arabinose transferase-like glycosyltransferase